MLHISPGNLGFFCSIRLQSSVTDPSLFSPSVTVDPYLAHLSIYFDLRSECLRLGETVRIEIRPFPDSDNTITEAVSKAFVVECGGMERTAVVPDCWGLTCQSVEQMNEAEGRRAYRCRSRFPT